jgi:hypothetical protein
MGFSSSRFRREHARAVAITQATVGRSDKFARDKETKVGGEKDESRCIRLYQTEANAPRVLRYCARREVRMASVEE